MISISEYINGRVSVVTRSVMYDASLVKTTDASDILAGEYAWIWRSCSRVTVNVRTDIGSRMLYTSTPLSTSMRLTFTSAIESCTRCTMFCSRILSESGTFRSVCSGIVLRMTVAIACPRVSLAAMVAWVLSFKTSSQKYIFHSLKIKVKWCARSCHASCAGTTRQVLVRAGARTVVCCGVGRIHEAGRCGVARNLE